MTTPPLSAVPQSQNDPARQGWTPLLAALPQGVLLADASGRYVEANPAATRILGLERAILLASGPIEPRSNLLAADGSPLPAEATPAAIAFRTGTPVRGTILGWIREQHDPLWLELSAEPLPGGGVLVSFEDISARIQAETALKESEARWHSLVEQAGDGFELLDDEGRYLQVNEASCRNLGYSREELLRMTLFEVDPAITLDIFRAQFQGLIEKPAVTFETVHRRKDGTDFPAQVTASVIRLGDHYRAMAQVRDITTWKREHAALQDSEQRYRSLFERMTEGYAHCRMIYDGNEPVDWVYLAVNPAFETLTGLQHATGRKVSDLIPGIRDSSPDLFEIYGRVARIGVPEQFESFVAGLGIWFSVHVFSPGPDEFVATFENITERKHGEEVLIQSEEQTRASNDLLRSIFESPKGVIIFALDASYRYTAFTESHQETMRALWGVEIQPGMSMLGAISRPDDREKARRNFNRALQGEQFLLEEEYGEDSLHRSWWQNRYSPIRGADGAVTGLTVFVIDITERRRAEVALKKAHEQLALAQRSAGAGMWDWDMATGQLNWSAELFILFGLDPVHESATFDIWKRVLHPEDAAGAADRIADAIAERKTLSSEYRIVLPGGGIRWIHALGSVHCDSEGQPTRMAGICLDITGRKDTEETLLRFRHFFEQSAWGKVIADGDSQVIAIANPAFAQMHGYSLDEMAGMPLADTFALDSRGDLAEHGRKVHEQGHHSYESLHLRKDGSTFPCRTQVTEFCDPEGRVLFLAGTFEDITDRKHVEAALSGSEARLREAQHLAHIGHWVQDHRSGQVTWSEELYRVHGMDPSGPPPDWASFQERLHPEDRPRVKAAFEGHLKERTPGFTAEFRAVLGGGEIRHLKVHIETEFDATGAPLRTLGTDQDITNQVAAREAIAKSEAGLATAQRISRVGSWEWDFLTNKVEWSAEMYRLFGLDPVSYDGTPEAVLKVVHPDDRAAFIQNMEQNLAQGETVPLEYRVVHPDGSVRTLFANGIVVLDRDGKPVKNVGTIQDITERKRAEAEHQVLEAQLQRVQKMDSLGNLAGGVAHDMNNVLGAIMGLASLHELQSAEGSTLRKSMETITKACLRGRTLLQGLLGFARQGLAEEKVIDLNALVAEQTTLLARTTLQKVNLVTELQEGLHPILGDPSALSHVLMNLCVNAVDAMPETGTLTLRTRNQGPAAVELEVEDTGIGMTAEVLAKATDPFFTTKPQGKGTGLGLSLVYGTVKAHRGQMDLRSALGEGTTITLQFPACAPVPAAIESKAGVQQPSRSLRVLVVDDDELLQTSLSWLLEGLGHTHEVVANGEAALDLLSSGLPFDVVILDLNMPGLGGEGTLPQLRALRPELPVLLATGRADQQARDLVERTPGATLMAKPFTLEELKKQLARMIK